MPTYNDLRDICMYLATCTEEERAKFKELLAGQSNTQSDFALKNAFDLISEERKYKRRMPLVYKSEAANR